MAARPRTKLHLLQGTTNYDGKLQENLRMNKRTKPTFAFKLQSFCVHLSTYFMYYKLHIDEVHKAV